MKMSVRERIARSVVIDEHGCWIWQRHIDRDGYGQMMVDRRPAAAHRMSHLIFIGAIPEGYEVDHLCFVRACVNPAHLEAVTRKVNLDRRRPGARGGSMRDWSSGTCRNGHELTPDSVYVAPSGKRQCRPCQRAAVAAYSRRKAAVR